MLLVPFQKGRPTRRTLFRCGNRAGDEPPDVLAAPCAAIPWPSKVAPALSYQNVLLGDAVSLASLS